MSRGSQLEDSEFGFMDADFMWVHTIRWILAWRDYILRLTVSQWLRASSMLRPASVTVTMTAWSG